MPQYGTYTEEEKREIKRRRLYRQIVSLVLAAAAGFLVYPFAITTIELLALPKVQLGAAIVLMIASVAIGWKPNYETMFGDQEVYVDEPEIGED